MQEIKVLEDKKLDTQKNVQPNLTNGLGAMFVITSKVRLKLMKEEVTIIALELIHVVCFNLKKVVAASNF